MKSIIEIMKLSQRERIALTGSGGKTNFMFELARELFKAGCRVLSTTTTKIHIPDPIQSPRWATIKNGLQEFKSKWESLSSRKLHYTIGWDVYDGKLTGIPENSLEEISSWNSVDVMIVEADGSKGKSLKGYRENEPVLIKSTRKVVIFVGVDILGKPLTEESVHRVDIVLNMLSVRRGTIITPEIITDILLHKEGYISRVGEREVIVVLNKIMDSSQYEAALLICKNVMRKLKNIKIFLRGPFLGVNRDNVYFRTKEVENL